MAPQDTFERWRALQAWSSDRTNRLDDQVDLAFWAAIADSYDPGALATRVPAVLQRVLSLVPNGWSVLDVGAGTGAFSIPLASRASRVTALDYSPAMLDVLRRKLEARTDLHHIAPVLARWEEAEVQPHDVVLAANALYRARNLHLTLKKLVCAARKRGIVVWSISRQDAPQHTVRESTSAGRYRPGPDYIHLLDGLFGLDVFANVEIIATDDTQRYATDCAAVESLLSWADVTPDEHARAAAMLPRVLDREADQWVWRRRGRVAIIWWDSPA